MAKIRTTLTLDAEVMRMVKGRAEGEGKDDSMVIEEALRRDLGLELLEKSWARNSMNEEQAIQVLSLHPNMAGRTFISPSTNET